MARYYVEKNGEWNIFSTVVDDFLFDEFICLDALKARLLYERFKELTEDIDSLLTDNPRVNVMTYSEAVERKQADTPQTEETCERCVYVRGSQWCQGCNGTPKRWDGEKIADTPQTDCDKCIWSVCNYNKVDWDADTPQTDCDTCKHYKLACELFSEICKYEP